MMPDGKIQPSVASTAAAESAHAHTHKSGAVNGDGTGRHFGDGDEVGKIRHSEPTVPLDHVILYEGNGGVSSAHAEQAHLYEHEK